METKILTILFTDLAGFTERTSTQSRSEINELLELQDSLIRPVIEKFRGTVIKTIGDAYMVTFESPTNAVQCGVAIQQEIARHNSDSDGEHQLNLRMGINSGEVNVKNDDVFGEAVNIASRIEALAEPGEVYFTDAVYLAMNKNEIPTAEVGRRHLKGIAEMVTVYKVLKEEGALASHLAKRKAAAMATGKLSKDGKIKKEVDKTKSSIARIIIIALIIIVAAFIILRVLASNAQPVAQPTIRDRAQQLSPREQEQLKELLDTPINELSDSQKEKLRNLQNSR